MKKIILFLIFIICLNIFADNMVDTEAYKVFFQLDNLTFYPKNFNNYPMWGIGGKHVTGAQS